MGRQSFLHIRLRPGADDAIAIEVGGGTVPVLEGVLRF
jgi:predicted PhzF superfamily epimerase YddE/YHI9